VSLGTSRRIEGSVPSKHHVRSFCLRVGIPTLKQNERELSTQLHTTGICYLRILIGNDKQGRNHIIQTPKSEVIPKYTSILPIYRLVTPKKETEVRHKRTAHRHTQPHSLQMLPQTCHTRIQRRQNKPIYGVAPKRTVHLSQYTLRATSHPAGRRHS
jgi:hypothetical protein